MVLAEVREPHKVLERSGGKPVAILKNSRLVGYLVPAEAAQPDEHRPATMDKVRAIPGRTRARS